MDGVRITSYSTRQSDIVTHHKTVTIAEGVLDLMDAFLTWATCMVVEVQQHSRVVIEVAPGERDAKPHRVVYELVSRDGSSTSLHSLKALAGVALLHAVATGNCSEEVRALAATLKDGKLP